MQPSFRLIASLAAAGAAAQSVGGFGLDDALSYMPSFSWLNGMQMQMPMGQGKVGLVSPDDFDFKPLSSFAANLSGGDSIYKWTFMPECLSTPTAKEPVCVFALHSFARGRGIAIVAPPSNASHLINSAAFQEGAVPEYANTEQINAMHEENVPGAGRGMFASKRLFQGDVLYAYTPILALSPDTDDLGDDKRLALFHKAVRSLPAPAQKTFWDLGTHQDNDPKVDPVQDRIDTNAFGFDLANVNFYVISPEIARINHDCRPNAVYHLNTKTMTQYVHIVRDVPPGEQLSVTYIDPTMSREERQSKLSYTWGFQCSCSACTQHPRLIEESDARLEQMEEFTDLLTEDGDDPDTLLSAEQGIEIAEALVHLYETERHNAAISEALTQAALAHSAAGHYYLTQAWARKALKAALIEDGLYDPSLGGLAQLCENPKKHWSWKMRADIGRAKRQAQNKNKKKQGRN